MPWRPRAPGGDVRVIQRGERLGLAREPREAIRIVRERLGQHLDGHVAVELRIARAIHLAHAAFANGRCNLVDAEAGAEGKGQRVRDYTGVRR